MHVMRVTIKLLSSAKTDDMGHMLLRVHLKKSLMEAVRWFGRADHETDRPRKTLVSTSGVYIRVPVMPLVRSTL